MASNEDDLSQIFATKVKDAPEFASGVLDHTKFAEHPSRAKLFGSITPTLKHS